MIGLILTIGVFTWASAMVGAIPSSSEDLGRRYFQSAQLFYTRGDFEQALKDWTFIIENLPKSAYADDALIAIGRYHLEVNHDPRTASRFFERVLAEYPQADKAPAAHYFQGRIRYDYGMTLADLQDALASFERVTVLYPRSGWAGEAALLAGEIHRLLGEPLKGRATCRHALRRLVEPRWIVRAWLCIARSYALEGQSDAVADAIIEMQRLPLAGLVRHMALNAATAYYRHHIRKATHALPYYGDPNFHLAGSIRLDDPKWLMPLPKGFALGDEDQKWVIRFEPQGKFKERLSFADLGYATSDENGRIYAVVKGDVMVPGVGRRKLRYTVAPGKQKQVKVKTLAVDRAGRLWVHRDGGGLMLFEVTREGKVLHRESAFDGRSFKLHRVQIDPWQRLWLISTKARSVRAYFRDGTPAVTLDSGRWRLEKPVAVGWDILGHIHILDVKRKAIVIYSPAGKYLKSVDLHVILQNVEPSDMVVMPDGSIYILDRATKTVFRLI